MSIDGDKKQCKCGSGRAVNLQRVSSIVRDIGEPCLHQRPIKINKMLKADKWQTTFDSDGKVYGFRKVLKLIVLGGVDPSIRREVWEFLLGCYTLSSTAEYRRQLRIARRERYEDLIKQCQKMHSNIGTGSLAYVVGSKVMDVRTMSKDERTTETEVDSRKGSNASASKLENYFDRDNKCTDTSYPCQSASSCDSTDHVSVRSITDCALDDSSCSVPTFGPNNCSSSDAGNEEHGSQCATESYFDFPHLPVADLFEESAEDKNGLRLHDKKLSSRRKLRFEDENMYIFQISNNSDLVMESSDSPSKTVFGPNNSDIEAVNPIIHEPVSTSTELGHRSETVSKVRISDAPKTPIATPTASQGGAISEDRVSEWLWTLHRIVVDVVRTDNHLEFYEDSKNLARMSDILAVYAWVDPATGYCQGMSDLLSPFVVLFEDNADAFWCFEMLLRRMRENFQMEGPTGVMKQLQALWKILELTDREMYTHLLHVGAESLHFAFPMLLVLFRRDLSFNEALLMWEMMWAADFDESMPWNLAENCPELLVITLPNEAVTEIDVGVADNDSDCSKGAKQSKNGNAEHHIVLKSMSAHPLCGLTGSFCSRNDHLQISSAVPSTRNVNDELPVFCVAAILVMNRQRIMKETHSIEDLIKTFNDKILKIRVKRCVRTAIKLRKKYFFKLIERNSTAVQNGESRFFNFPCARTTKAQP